MIQSVTHVGRWHSSTWQGIASATKPTSQHMSNTFLKIFCCLHHWWKMEMLGPSQGLATSVNDCLEPGLCDELKVSINGHCATSMALLHQLGHIAATLGKTLESVLNMQFGLQMLMEKGGQCWHLQTINIQMLAKCLATSNRRQHQLQLLLVPDDTQAHCVGLFDFECGTVPFLILDSLSPNIADLPTGMPIYISINCRSVICSVAILAATNSDGNGDVSTAFFL